MRKIAFIIFLISTFIVKAQHPAILIEYQYQFKYLPNFKSFLVADDQVSYFFFTSDYSMSYEDLEKQNFKKANSYNFFVYDKVGDRMYQTMGVLNGFKDFSSRLTKDTLPKIDWKIKSDKKEILGYSCNLAVGKFRGRDYKVWFTLDIPVADFPWKLKGLPGAILEFESDEDHVIKGEVTKIVINPNVKFPSNLVSIYDEHKKLAVPYRQFIEQENVFIKEMRERMKASTPVGTTFQPMDLRQAEFEISFEWEEE